MGGGPSGTETVVPGVKSDSEFQVVFSILPKCVRALAKLQQAKLTSGCDVLFCTVLVFCGYHNKTVD